ncbi:MAG TPA: GNAT family N-acetyltransferase [Thermoanaerobaculia bacterium]|nr:GNAT family N-acetyltransferase [Thermoanaerobaculia bacterium]
MTQRAVGSPSVGAFSEKGFYLQEFRGRTVGVLLPAPAEGGARDLAGVLEELRANSTWVILVAGRGLPSGAFDCDALPARRAGLEGAIWRALRGRGRVLVESDGDPFAALLDLSRRLSLHKVVRLCNLDGVADREGRRRAFVDLDELGAIRAEADAALREVLGEVERLLHAGVPNVNLCTAAGMHDELFTYSGSGTLFTRERYVVVRPLGIDDYDAADDLIARGVAEGFLAPRSPEAVDRLLPDGFGAFVEGRHLAGIGALRVPPGAAGGEVAGLYTVTRFTGQGLGAHLVSFAVESARELGLEYVYACTTAERVGAWFQRFGFRPVDLAELPPEKWRGYDPQRRARLSCYRRDLG